MQGPASLSPPLSQPRFRRTLTWAVVAPPVAALALAAVFLWQVFRLLNQEQWVSHTDEVIACANNTQESLLRIQVAVRGFLLSGEPLYTSKYREAEQQVPKQAERLVRLVSDNPPQVHRARQIASLVERSRAVAISLVHMRESGGEYTSYLRSPAYLSLVNERDQAFTQFMNVEEGLRVQRSRRVTRTVPIVVAVSLGLTTVIGIVLGVATRRTFWRLSATYETALETVRQARDELERRVDDRTAQLQDAVNQLEAFNYTVSHDLRAPLRAMQGFSQALEEDFSEALDARAKQYIHRITAAAERMDQLIQDLLDYSRLSRADLPLGPVDLNAAVAEAVAQVSGERDEARIHVEGPLPTAFGNGPTLVQAITNLLSNCLKFVPDGQAPDVRVCATQADGHVRLWVEDHGIGIAPEHQARIFNIFERLHGAEEYPGTGIGLAIVRRAAERMGGSCGVESEPGKGSRFWIELNNAEGHTGHSRRVDQ